VASPKIGKFGPHVSASFQRTFGLSSALAMLEKKRDTTKSALKNVKLLAKCFLLI
jgi:hypothetical protein